MLTWDKPDERYYETGLDRGVIYPSKVKQGPVSAENLIQHDVSSFVPISTGVGTDTTLTVIAAGGDGYGGRAYRRITVNTAFTPSAGADIYSFMGSAFGVSSLTMSIPTTVGLPYSLVVPVRASIAQKVWVQAQGITATGGGNTKEGATVTLVPNQWTLLVVENWVPGSTTVGVRLDVDVASSPIQWPVGATIDVARPAIYQSAAVPTIKYLDGDTASDGLHTFEWEGAALTSKSVQRDIIGTAIPWNGLTSFDEGAGGETTILYRDGKIYLADVDASDFSGRMTALYWPDEFSECLGIPRVADGLYVDNQKPKRFGLSYRTLIGSGTSGDMFGYQIHLVYNAMASYGMRSRKTIGSSTELTEFNFDISASPVRLPGFRPSAHYVIDTRSLGASTIAQLEAILYGGPTQAPRLPTPTELYDLLNFGDSIVVTKDADGWITITGSEANVHELDDSTAEVKGINATTAGDGTITISAGGNTTIV